MIEKTKWVSKLSNVLKEPGFSKKPGVEHRFMVEIAKRRSDNVSSIIESNQGKIHYEIGLIPLLVTELPFAALEELAGSRHVKRIWHDARVHMALNIAVPTAGGNRAQQLGLTGKGVTVAVLDTGIYPHRDLTAPANRIVAWADLVNQKESPYDDNGHGTHITGIIAGNGGSANGKYKGMAPEARLVGVKVLNQDGSGLISTVISGLEWCLDKLDTLGIRVINLSMGSKAQESYKSDPLCRAVTVAWQRGIIVCCAAGNEGPQSGTINSPGINLRTITVGNFNDRLGPSATGGQLNQSSSRGPTLDNLVKPDLLAPGTKITSLLPGGGYHSLTGTSMSTAMVAGAAVQIVQQRPSIKPDRVKSLLMKGAKDLGLKPNLQGAGVLNMDLVLDGSPKKRNITRKLNIQRIFGIKNFTAGSIN